MKNTRTKLIVQLANRLFPGLLYKAKHKYWENAWHQVESAGLTPSEIPPELKEAFDSGWLSIKGSALDIGCGSGQVAHELATLGFMTVGCDFSAQAISMAQSRFANTPNLSFTVADMTVVKPEFGKFDFFIDRGCYHGIPIPLRKNYVTNIVAWSNPMAKFLLITRIDEDIDSVRDEVTLRLGDHFSIDRVEETSKPLRRSGSIDGKSFPACYLWMTRLT